MPFIEDWVLLFFLGAFLLYQYFEKKMEWPIVWLCLLWFWLNKRHIASWIQNQGKFIDLILCELMALLTLFVPHYILMTISWYTLSILLDWSLHFKCNCAFLWWWHKWEAHSINDILTYIKLYQLNFSVLIAMPMFALFIAPQFEITNYKHSLIMNSKPHVIIP